MSDQSAGTDPPRPSFPFMQPSLSSVPAFSHTPVPSIDQNTVSIDPGILRANNVHAAQPSSTIPVHWFDDDFLLEPTNLALISDKQKTFMASYDHARPASMSVFSNGEDFWPADVFDQYVRVDEGFAHPGQDYRVLNEHSLSQNSQEDHPEYQRSFEGAEIVHEPDNPTPELPDGRALHISQADQGIMSPSTDSNDEGFAHNDSTLSVRSYNTNQVGTLSLQAALAARNYIRAMSAQGIEAAGMHTLGQPLDFVAFEAVNRINDFHRQPQAVPGISKSHVHTTGQLLQGKNAPIPTEVNPRFQPMVSILSNFSPKSKAAAIESNDRAAINRFPKQEEKFYRLFDFPIEILNMILIHLLGNRSLTIAANGGMQRKAVKFRSMQRADSNLLHDFLACRRSCKLLCIIATEVFFRTNYFDFQYEHHRHSTNTFMAAHLWIQNLPMSFISMLTNVEFAIKLNGRRRGSAPEMCGLLRELGNSLHLKRFKMTVFQYHESLLSDWEIISKILEQYRAIKTPIIEFVPAQPQISGPLQHLMSKARHPGLGGQTRGLPVRSSNPVEYPAILSWRKNKPEIFTIYAHACGIDPKTSSLIPTAIARQIALYIRDDRSHNTMPGPLVETHKDARKMTKTKLVKKSEARTENYESKTSGHTSVPTSRKSIEAEGAGMMNKVKKSDKINEGTEEKQIEEIDKAKQAKKAEEDNEVDAANGVDGAEGWGQHEPVE